MRLPWGKYKGRALSAVPASYLCWLLEETDIDAYYRAAIRAELVDRLALAPEPAVLAGPPELLAATFKELLALGYRTLAPRVHPDRGGDLARMQQLNACRDWCRTQGWL